MRITRMALLTTARGVRASPFPCPAKRGIALGSGRVELAHRRELVERFVADGDHPSEPSLDAGPVRYDRRKGAGEGSARRKSRVSFPCQRPGDDRVHRAAHVRRDETDPWR